MSLSAFLLGDTNDTGLQGKKGKKKMRKQKTVHITIMLLLSALTGIVEAVPGESKGEQTEYNSDIARLVNVISMSPAAEETRRAEMDQAMAELRAIGDGAIEPLMVELRRSHMSAHFRHRTVGLLRSIGTPKAREGLLQIALGQYSPREFGSGWAARKYVEIMQEQSDAKKLLVSNDTDVQAVALSALRGVSVDIELLTRLEGFLQSDHYLRASAAKVIATDPERTLVQQKVSALVRSLETVEQLPRAGEKYQYDRVGTLADNVFYQLTDSLSKTRGTEHYLHAETSKAQGNVRLCLTITRGHRGDTSVKGELYNFLKDSKARTMTLMRCSALQAFEVVGTVDDLPFLQGIAETDSLEVVDFGGPLFEILDGKIVNTGERMRPIPVKTHPNWSRARGYPVRSAAKRAIEAIEKRRSGQRE